MESNQRSMESDVEQLRRVIKRLEHKHYATGFKGFMKKESVKIEPDGSFFVGFGYVLRAIMAIALFLALVCLLAKNCHAESEKRQIVEKSPYKVANPLAPKGAPEVLAIIGEAENQGFDGMLAVACTISNRGTLKGVYGLHAPRVLQHKYSNETYAKASTAWDLATESYESNRDYCGFIKHATGWGNSKDLVQFKKTTWWKNCKIVAVVKDHFFYKEAA